jgi:hypothetical protein
MALFNTNTTLSKDQLLIRLSNTDGQAINVDQVRFSILDSNGTVVRGPDLVALSQGNGAYYAPVSLTLPNGSYEVKWSVTQGTSVQVFSSNIFVKDDSSYVCSPGNPYNLRPDAIPPPGSLAYITGSLLGPQDLFINFKDSSTLLPRNPYSIFFTVYNSVNFAVSPRTAGSYYKTGTFWANWKVSVGTGDYSIRWDFQQIPGSPIEIATQYFTVINPSNLNPDPPTSGCSLSSGCENSCSCACSCSSQC